ncbi:MAG TPA: alpha/beta fold hydrolase [Terriglobales bacterium]|nr:alpha/beta fold hydrolase [Terriglobales bacterium]
MELRDDFVPRAGLRNGHVQTILPAFLRRRSALPPAEDRLFRVEAEVQLLCHCHWQPGRQARLTEILVHGLEGSAESQYVIGNGSKAWEAGWNVVRVNVRNCGGTHALGPTLYHSGLSGDVRAVVEALIAEEKLERIALVGYSMGGNMVLKVTGEWGGAAPPQLKAVAAVSPGVDLDASATLLHHWKNRIYEQHFVRSLKKNMRRKARLFPGRYDLARLRGLSSIRDFDEHITAFYWGFQGASDYYRRASAARVIDQITVPTLIIHALDDPFIEITAETRQKILANPHIRFLGTKHGGHCGFLADAADGYDGRWAERKIMEFLTGARPDCNR